MNHSTLREDYKRYGKPRDMPPYQKYYRLANATRGGVRLLFIALLRITRKKYLCDFPLPVQIGPGLYIGHPYAITINPDAVIGKHVSLSKGVTIGQENRGKRKGVPTIGDNVWVGVNATIVGKVYIGNDVLVAPNSFVNCDVPDHSVVYGNPCVIKHVDNATMGYL